MPPLNQQALADRLKLSRTTVSRSLSNHPAISAETRARVLAAAAEQGYQGIPTRAVRRSRQSKPVTIGVVIGVPKANAELTTFPFILQGVRQRAEIDHVAVDIVFENPPNLLEDRLRRPILRNIRARDWRGILLIYPFPEAVVDALARKISTVAVLESYANPTVDTIDTDDVAGIVTLVDRLVAAGHRRIGFAAWSYPVGGHWTLRRFGGYVQGLCAHGLEIRPDWSCNVAKNAPRLDAAGVADFAALRVRSDGVTAFVCAADHQAYQLIHDLKARGLRVPGDVSVTGFDGLEPPAGLPRVASMRVPHQEIGHSAVARLISRILHPKAPRRKILVEALSQAGDTIAPPAA
ncbi:MAG TPA: LacI family DNA-binding transcriptional regulator [Opitutaceae bacterium]|nr:LacI family DNA-binding transcriptional regulator [Opitutaceae bacterium]